jgi:fructosamine-3-kinase
VQKNDPHTRWEDFFVGQRITPLVRRLFDAGIFSKHDLQLLEHFTRSVQHIFPPAEPSLLHGDLWSGNFLIDTDGKPVLIDPAVYCGHREMDMAMTRLFGGFADQFYAAYEAAYPLAEHWLARLKLAQLYPLLVHAVLFGGHYVAAARAILKDPV